MQNPVRRLGSANDAAVIVTVNVPGATAANENCPSSPDITSCFVAYISACQRHPRSHHGRARRIHHIPADASRRLRIHLLICFRLIFFFFLKKKKKKKSNRKSNTARGASGNSKGIKKKTCYWPASAGASSHPGVLARPQPELKEKTRKKQKQKGAENPKPTPGAATL